MRIEELNEEKGSGVEERAEEEEDELAVNDRELVQSGVGRGGDGIMGTNSKRLFVGAGARALFYPTLVYNVVRNKIQADFRWWDWIDEV